MSSNTAEVVIIGGGIIGNATAYYLAKLGMDVIVLEGSDHIGNGGSSRNGGGMRILGTWVRNRTGCGITACQADRNRRDGCGSV